MGTIKPDLVCVGAIAGSFGVRGETRLKSFCATPEDIAKYAPLTDAEGTRSFTLKITRSVKGGFVVRLGGVATKEQADAMKGFRLFAPRDRLPTLPDDEYYHSDLLGMMAVDTGGEEIGKVSAVDDFGGGDFLEIALKDSDKPLMIPFTLEAVPTVDLAAGRIIVDPPEDVGEP
jgi:16S rRNA processing protein RimM